MTGELIGKERACRNCGVSIKFLKTYDAQGAPKFHPATPDGTPHNCLRDKERPVSGDDMLEEIAQSVGVDVRGMDKVQAIREVSKAAQKTPAEIMQLMDSLAKSQNILKMQGQQLLGKGQKSGQTIEEIVERAIEHAAEQRQSGGKQESTGGGGEDGAGEADAGEGLRQDSGEGGESEGGTGLEGTGSGASEGSPEMEKEQEGEVGEEMKVDKEVLKSIAQQLKDQIKKETTKVVEKRLVLGETVQVDTSGQHYLFEEFVQLLVEGERPFLVGPAGSGKTTAALNAAPILGQVFERSDYTTYVKSFCMMSGKHELEGFIDANGVCRDTDFRKAFVEGHFYFMDEVDAANANIILVLNAAIDNGVMSFPDGMKERHKDFRIGVGANTVGLGADAVYAGRTQLDAAFRNRFYFLAWEYDERMELQWAGEDQKEWVLYVQKLRKAQQSLGKSAPRMVISPRASIRGARRLRQGTVKAGAEGFEVLANALIWQGCHEDDKAKVLANVREMKRK